MGNALVIRQNSSYVANPKLLNVKDSIVGQPLPDATGDRVVGHPGDGPLAAMIDDEERFQRRSYVAQINMRLANTEISKIGIPDYLQLILLCTRTFSHLENIWIRLTFSSNCIKPVVLSSKGHCKFNKRRKAGSYQDSKLH